MEHEWQLPPTVDRMEVNAALTVLTERFDADAARLVIRAFCDMPVSASSFDEFRDSKRTNRTITGETPEFGSVGIRETVDESRWEGGAEHVARVGQFKVYRMSNAAHETVAFRRYWKGSLATAFDIIQEQQLAFRASDKLPLALARIVWSPQSPSLLVRLRVAIQYRNFPALWRSMKYWTPRAVSMYTHPSYRLS